MVYTILVYQVSPVRHSARKLENLLPIISSQSGSPAQPQHPALTKMLWEPNSCVSCNYNSSGSSNMREHRHGEHTENRKDEQVMDRYRRVYKKIHLKGFYPLCFDFNALFKFLCLLPQCICYHGERHNNKDPMHRS